MTDDPVSLRARVEEHIRRHALIDAGGAVTCLVSGGPDSTCLWHILRLLGYRVLALHVNHKLRGEESEEDARFCAEALGAEVVEAPGAGRSEAELRAQRYSVGVGRLRATGHTASDQVETILYRLATSGTTTGIRVSRSDGVVRPLLGVWRDETEAYCRAEALRYRIDSSNAGTRRGAIRERIVPLLRELHPAAEANILAVLQGPELPRPVARAIAELLVSRDGSKRIDLGGGRVAVREYEHLWLEAAPRRLDEPVRWGPWTIAPVMRGLVVRGWRPGDRLAGPPERKVQDLFVNAKIPRSEREGWPLVVRGDEVVVVPGVATAPGYEEAVVLTRSGA